MLRGLLWRPAALLLLLLQGERQAAEGPAAVQGIRDRAAALGALRAKDLDESVEALSLETERIALALLEDELSDAGELATPALRRRLAEAVLLALRRMQQRERLTALLVNALTSCSGLQSAPSERAPPDFRKVRCGRQEEVRPARGR